MDRRQAWWQEFLTEYDFKIAYVKGGDNTVADSLSRMPEGGEGTFGTTAAVLNVSMDPKMSEDIRVGYKSDAFRRKVLDNLESFPAIRVVDGLVYVGSWLVVPRVGTIREDLFQAAHDSLGHFGNP